MSIGKTWRGQRAALLAAALAQMALFPADVRASGEQRSWEDPERRGPDICGGTTRLLFEACELDSRDDERVRFAICRNVSERQEAEACLLAAREARREAFATCRAVRNARGEVCEALGRGAYDPVLDPANFVSRIDNPYAPFPPGAFREYEKKTAAGLERIRIEVLPETREILGVEVTTLRDTVTLDGVLVEDTLDWLAQDVHGNVWYFGEISQSFDEGLLANLDGSFEAGKGGAKAGFWIKAAPKVGELYRQEWALGNAEDVVEVVSVDARDTDVPFRENGSGPVLKTRDFTPLSPGIVEYKYYVPGVGFALEVDPETGERLELIDYGPR
jgi:hypothetical protein